MYVGMLKFKTSHGNLIDNEFDKFTFMDIKTYHKHTNKTTWHLEKEKRNRGNIVKNSETCLQPKGHLISDNNGPAQSGGRAVFPISDNASIG